MMTISDSDDEVDDNNDVASSYHAVVLKNDQKFYLKIIKVCASNNFNI